MGTIAFRRGNALAVLGCIAVASACAPELDTSRTIPVRGTVGEEVFGVLCDRVGAQALQEDLTGASFQAVCHKAPDGSWSQTVDTSVLPPLVPNALDMNGNPVPLATQEADRAHAVARIQALAADRTKLISAIDETIPNVQVPIKDIYNPDATKSCNAAGEGPLPRALAEMVGRLTSLYDDGTIPESTESLGRLLSAFEQAQDARDAYARLSSREGYRPIDVALGIARPVMGYPELRDFASATLSLLSSNSDPFASKPVPGAAYPQLTALLGAAYQELRSVQFDDPPVAPLAPVKTDSVGRQLLSRPRTDLEFMQALLYAQNPSFGDGTSAYIVQRDVRGYAQVALTNGLVPPPFVDANADGMADVDALGQFLTTSGQPAPSPFFAVGAPAAAARDAYGRALTGPSGKPVYASIDTNQTFARAVMNDLKPLVNSDPKQNHETLMDALAGAYALFGSRDGTAATVKQYGPDPSAAQTWSLTNSGAPPKNLTTTPVELKYDAFHADDAPILDLLYAGAQVLGDPSVDDTLQLARALMVKDPNGVARLVGAVLDMRAVAAKHPEAQIPAKSTFWDELIDVAIELEQDGPATDGSRLLEDMITSMGDPASGDLGQAFSHYYAFNDEISYNRSNINGGPFNLTTNNTSSMQTPVDRTMPDSGYNRSAFQRFIALVHDTDGLTVCNKDGATINAEVAGLSVTLPVLGGSYSACQVFLITNAAQFYLDAIVGKGQLWIRDNFMRNGVLGLGAANVGLMEDSSGITGFWGENQSATSLFPTPQFLDRQMFFDLANDSPNSGDRNYKTNHFLRDLQGLNGVGSSVCPEKVISDPCVPGNANDCTGQSYFNSSTGSSQPNYGSVLSDGMIHGLRSCGEGDSLVERDDNTIFTWEDFNFYKAMTPMLNAFVKHNREDLFVKLMGVLNRHWADAHGSASECKLSSDPNATYKNCSKDGLVAYEPLLAQAFATDFLPALSALEQTVAGMTVNHCDQIDPTGHECIQSHGVKGVSVLAAAARALLDPAHAAVLGLTDRHGTQTALRNDGTTNAQVTPIYLITGALDAIDTAFATYATAHPKDTGRQALWTSARSQLVDQFFGVSGSMDTAQFTDPAIPAIAPVIIDTIRAQLFANCPSTFTTPAKPCEWTRKTLTENAADIVGGPLFAGMMDVADALRANAPARAELEQLMGYMMDTASQNNAFASVLAAADDAVQVLRDDTNLVPFFHILANAASPSITDANGTIVQKGMSDAQMSLLSRISGKAFAADGKTELCSQEMDPNQVLPVILTRLVTPVAGQDGQLGETPLESMLDVIADVNRAGPGQTTKLSASDYGSIADNVVDFLMDRTRGLEQFYAIIKQGTE